ncbi:MAG: LysR family transcriptional regulator [Pirellulaceae bacterium]
MEFDQLRNFLEVAQRQNFTRAAEEVGLSQPALSRSISRLEQELGQPLFERQTRRVVLTDAGTLLQARARQILALIEDARAEISDDGRTGRIRLAAIPTIAPYFLPELLREFAQRFPDAVVSVQEETTDKVLRRCQEGEIDLAIVALPVAVKHLEVEALFEEELLLVVPNEHELATRRKVTLAEVEPFPFVLLDEAHCLSDQIISFCRRREFQPVSMERTSQLATVQELVSLGHGISMIPAMARRLDLSQRRVYRSLDGQRPTREIAMAWNPYRYQSTLLEQFKQQVRAFVERRATTKTPPGAGRKR